MSVSVSVSEGAKQRGLRWAARMGDRKRTEQPAGRLTAKRAQSGQEAPNSEEGADSVRRALIVKRAPRSCGTAE